MKEKVKHPHEDSAIWGRKKLPCFKNHARPKTVKTMLHKRRRRVAKRELNEGED